MMMLMLATLALAQVRPAEPEAESTDDTGVVEGIEAGVEGGVVGGVVGGVLGGPIPPQIDTSGSRRIHKSDILYKKVPRPEYPAGLEALELGEQRCIAHVFIGTDGRVEDVQTAQNIDCIAAFVDATNSAMREAVWYPYKVDGKKTRVNVMIPVRFQPPR